VFTILKLGLSMTTKIKNGRLKLRVIFSLIIDWIFEVLISYLGCGSVPRHGGAICITNFQNWRKL